MTSTPIRDFHNNSPFLPEEFRAFSLELPDLRTREDYLAWRTTWRRQYAILSVEIRKQKAVASATMRSGEYGGIEQARAHSLRCIARIMMEQREEATLLAKAARRAHRIENAA